PVVRGRIELIDQLILEDRSIAAMIVLVIEEHTGIASELQLGPAGIVRARRHDMDEIVVFGGGAARMIQSLVVEYLTLAVSSAFRTIDSNAVMDAAQQML